MLDERDPLLQRTFALSQRPLVDAQFVAQVRERLPMFSARRLVSVVLSSIVRAVVTGLFFGILAPLRLRRAGFAALAGLGVVVWMIIGGSL